MSLAAGGVFAPATAEDAQSGAVIQTVPPPVSQKPSVPALQLSDEQRTKIREAVAAAHSDASFALKKAKPAQNFEPSIGATLPKGLTPHPLPRPLIYEIPLLKRYAYVKFKDEVLIVNPMTRKIVGDVSDRMSIDRIGTPFFAALNESGAGTLLPRADPAACSQLPKADFASCAGGRFLSGASGRSP